MAAIAASEAAQGDEGVRHAKRRAVTAAGVGGFIPEECGLSGAKVKCPRIN